MKQKKMDNCRDLQPLRSAAKIQNLVTLLLILVVNIVSNGTIDMRSHNKIDGEALLAAAVEIDGRQRRHLVKLDLTFNFIYGHVEHEIQRRYRTIAKSVAAPSLFPGADR